MLNRRTYYRRCERIGLTPTAVWVLIIYYLVCLGLQQALPYGETLAKSPLPYAILGIYIVLACTVFLFVRAVQKKPRWRDLGYLLVALLLYFSFFNTFGYVKSLIPVLNPYHWDPLLQRIDMALHFGRTPYAWLASIASDRWYVIADRIYLFGWLGAMFCYFFWQVFSFDMGASRTVFLSSFILVWILEGNVLATLFSSVGPTFYPLFYTDGYSAMNQAMIDHIASIHAHTPLLDAGLGRALVLSFYNSETLTSLNGISAMPSMHNAATMLMAIHSIRYFPKLAWVMVPLAVAVFLSSLLLGWHYAIDAYAALILTYGIWMYCRWEVARPARLQAAHPGH